MDDWLQAHWGLVAAAILFVPAAVVVLRELIAASAGGRLHLARRRLAKARRAQRNLAAQRQQRERRVEAMLVDQAHVRPRVLQDARDALQDAAALLKIAADQVLIAENKLRKVIHEDYVPARHESLRQKYLPDDRTDDKPFSF